MSAGAKELPPDTDPEQVHRGIQTIAGMGPMVANLTLVVWYWGQWSAVIATGAVGAVLTVTNQWFVEWYARRRDRVSAEWIRILANTAGICVSGHYTQWSPLVLAFVPYNMLWFYGLDRWVRPRLAVYLAVVSAYAPWDGAPPERVLAFSLLGVFGYLLTEKRAALLRQVLRQGEAQRAQLERAHQQLQQAHQHALAQEKLSSLGMMAAGVAHEINNPMSFVTSNVHSLYKDLRRQPALPAALQEYVDEVLPETLAGIRRVNAIMSDLRRFARGDPEAHAEYDLNTEVQSALRIAQGALSHCQVELEPGEVGRLVGRPRQIVQVVVNLLVNAGQATPANGGVRLSTHREGDGARVEIRDTGAGMTPEALRNLFQPFFTTRPPGEGLGLGLAVAHGIVSAHGGRIEVESAPGTGACFTVHLPRRPPLPAYSAPMTDAHAGDSHPVV